MHCNRKGSFASVVLTSIRKNRTNFKEKMFAFNNKEYRYVKFDELVAQWREKRYYQKPFYYKSLTNCKRKLLSYSDETIHVNSMKSEQLDKTGLHENDRKIFLRNIENDDQNELWDDWGNWSTCSVTCGDGRQVRWRHCSAEHCIKGLKRAQIKTCRLKKCDSRNILNWLGIKTR